jgi:hypothetical protein
MLWTNARDLRTRPTKDKITNECERVLIKGLGEKRAIPAGGPAILAVMSPAQVNIARDRARWRLPISLVVAQEGLVVGSKLGFDKHHYMPMLSSDVVAVAAAQTASGFEFTVTHKLAGEIRLTFGSAAELEFLVQTFGAGGIDPMSATMALVEALAADDKPAIERAAQDVSSLSPGEVIQSLGKFGMLFAKGFTPEHKQVIRAELVAAAGPEPVRAAVLDIGTELLINVNAKAAAQAVGAHAKRLGPGGEERFVPVTRELISATARIVRKLDIKLHWKPANVRSDQVYGQ